MPRDSKSTLQWLVNALSPQNHVMLNVKCTARCTDDVKVMKKKTKQGKHKRTGKKFFCGIGFAFFSKHFSWYLPTQTQHV